MADRLTAAERRVVRAAMAWSKRSIETWENFVGSSHRLSEACAALERARKGAKRER